MSEEIRHLVLRMVRGNPTWDYDRIAGALANLGHVMGAIDFTTIEVWTKGGLVIFCLLFVMEVATRRVHFAGCTVHPNEDWMKQIARDLTDPVDEFLHGTRYLLMDRDSKFFAIS